MDPRRRSLTRAALGAAASVPLGWLTACGGGGSGDNASASTGGSVTPVVTAASYTAVAAVGDLLTYTLDPTGGLFRYTILDSLFGLAGRAVTGSLGRAFDPLFDGAFIPGGLGNSRIFTLPGGVLVGVIREIVAGSTERTIPIIGFQAPSTALAAIAGTYNYVGTNCTSPGSGCTTQHGQLVVNADGTWSICRGAPACTPAASGTLNALGEGRWQMLVGAATVGTLVGAQIAAQRMVIVDLTDTRSGGLGSGALVGAIAQAITTSEVNGVWYFNSSDGQTGYFNVSGLIVAGFVFGGDSFASALQLNAPAAGFIRTLQGGFGLMAAPGVYVLEQNGRFEVGLKVR